MMSQLQVQDAHQPLPFTLFFASSFFLSSNLTFQMSFFLSYSHKISYFLPSSNGRIAICGTVVAKEVGLLFQSFVLIFMVYYLLYFEIYYMLYYRRSNINMFWKKVKEISGEKMF